MTRKTVMGNRAGIQVRQPPDLRQTNQSRRDGGILHPWQDGCFSETISGGRCHELISAAPSMLKLPFSNDRGLTLTELLTVVAVLAILAALLMPVVPEIVAASHKSRCVANLRQIGAVIHLYAAENNGDLVPTLQRSFNTTGGTVWFQLLHQAEMFEKKGARPSWHLDPKGMFTCPSPHGRDSGRERVVSADKLPKNLNASFYAYDGSQYAMVNALGDLSNIRGWDAPSGGKSPEDLQFNSPLKMGQFERPGSMPLVGESNYQYQLSKSRPDDWAAFPHQEGWNLLYLDGSVRYEKKYEGFFRHATPETP